MAEVIDAWKGNIVSFEVSYPAYLESLQNARNAHCYNSITYPYDVRHAPIEKLMKAKVNFVFIDGQKSQYGEYMEIIEKIISPHTVIVIDDVIKYHNKLESLYGFLKEKQINYEILQLEPDDGVMIING